MHRFLRPHIRVRQQGQTLIIALIVLGVLLILGLVFLGVINRNILNASRSQRRSEAADLATGGIAYAHAQLVSSPLGADWRGTPTNLATDPAAQVTGDPDVYYLRPGSALPLNGGNDLGGPDGLGPYVRLQYPSGRALVRVRYGASDANPASVAGGPLRNPGGARATLIIEAVGRTGTINPNDPTTVNQTGGIQFRNFASEQQRSDALAQMANADSQLVTSRRIVAFAPIGIIDAARFETNVFNSSSPIELGISDGLGAQAFNDTGAGPTDVGSNVAMQLGTFEPVRDARGNLQGQYGGSLIANGDLMLYGKVDTYLNRALGDGIRVAGRITGANGAQLRIASTNFVPGTGFVSAPVVTLTDGGGSSFDSQDASFSTANGLVMDGSQRTDPSGFVSGVGALVPPSILTVDPDTKLNRYVSMTRETGTLAPGGASSGAFGHGSGVYVDNAADRQEPADSESRRQVGSQRSLFDDWLNPNSGAGDSGWQGPFYRPKGAVVQLLTDGFAIQRDGAADAERYWKRPDGTVTSESTIRYRLGVGLDGRTVHVLDTFTTPDINAQNISAAQFEAGPVFNGVLYFEGNVRVRGTIPTGVQMTIVSGATAYIEGSILKGTAYNDVVRGGSNQARGATISTLPTASLMLMARDNVAVNTTMFLGPMANQLLESVNDASGATSLSPVKLAAAGGTGSGSLSLVGELPLDPYDPTTDALRPSPSQWLPYALNYRTFDTGAFVKTQLLVSSTMDDGTGSASFYGLNVNVGSATDDATQYLFNANETLIRNAYASYTGARGGVPVYGLGVEPWQTASRFETRGFSLIDSAAATVTNNGQITNLGPGRPTLFAGGNDFRFRPSTVAGVSANDTLIARAALAPSDVRIEASIFAEQGSFFVIPGPWFNPNPNDTHQDYENRIVILQGSGLSLGEAVHRANRERLESYGTSPEAPFYGEPLDVRVTIVGSVAENLPPSIAVQSEWVRKWGWIPSRIGGRDDATGLKTGIPLQHVPTSQRGSAFNFVPNLLIQYDPILATGRVNNPGGAAPIRVDSIGRPLPPMPRLPVSPKLAYFGEL